MKKLFKIGMSIYFLICLLLSGSISIFADEVKPIHEYTFDSDADLIAYDSVEKGAINGKYLSDNTNQFITGYNGEGKAIHLNGENDGIYVGKAIIPIGTKSIRFKFRKDPSTVIADKTEPIINNLGSNGGVGFYLGIGKFGYNEVPGRLYAYTIIANSVKNFEIQSPESICDGQWHDVLFTWDGTVYDNSVKLYVDDMTTPVAQATASSTVESVQGYPYIGKCISTNNIKQVLTGDLDNIQIYSSVIKPESSTPVVSSNLTATGGTSKIDLTWNTIDKATSYTIKRATTAGGPYTTIATDVAETSYTDTDVTSGTTYYYIVTAVNTGIEITDSNEASAEPIADQTPPTAEAKLKVVLEVAESLRLSVDDDLAVNTQMAWSSLDPTVATVNEKGIVTALSTGNTVITVKSVDGSYTDYINVLVVENADDYRLAIDLKVGETARLTADDFTNTANVTWAPMDSSIANVTTKGKVTALSKGLVLITAKDVDGNIIGRVYVRVRE